MAEVIVTDVVEQLQRDEGLRLFPYTDTVGKLTIGYGRNLDAEGISSQEAQVLLANDIIRVREQLSASLPWSASLDDRRLGVLINMAFNMGMHGLMAFRKMLGAMQQSDYAAAADEMAASVWATQVGARATRLAEQMRTGEWQ